MRVADLHLHTIFSDGTYTPAELVQEAAKQGLAAIAVADHDTLDGIAPVSEIASSKKIEVLPAIELSAESDGLEIHLLGYFVDARHQGLQQALITLRKNRIERIYKIVDKLKEINLQLNAQTVFEIAAGGTVGRLHVARAMVKEGLVSSQQEAFQKFIGDKGPAYVCNFRLTPKEAIKLIKDAGGIPVLAHPHVLHRDDLIPQFVDCGLMGLEVYYPEHTQSMINFYLNLAKGYNLLVTGGSDCHGNAKPEVKIGLVKIPYELVEKLKAAKEKL